MPRALLASLPPEVMVAITNVLDGKSIALLYACGHTRLNCLLAKRGGLRTFQVRYHPPLKYLFPSIIHRFRTLENIHIKCSDQVMIHGVDYSILPPSVRYLDIRFWNGILSLFSWNASGQSTLLDIASLFPSLERLRTRETIALRPEDFIPRLPLTILHVSLDRDCPSYMIAALPRSVRKLRLTMDAEAQDWSKDPNFPPNLTSLRLNRLTNLDVVQWLPAHLSILELNVGHNAPFWDSDIDEQAIWQSLPTMLQDLEISVRILTVSMLKILPPLHTLRIRVGPKTRVTYSHIGALPQSLTQFFCNNPSMLSSDLSMIKMLPLGLTKLPNFFNIPDLCLEEIKAMPSALKYLELKKLLPGWLRLLPKTLTSLTCTEGGSSCDDFETFPSTMRKMKLGQCSESFLRAIQRSVLPSLSKIHVYLESEHQLLYLPDRLVTATITFPKTLTISSGEPFMKFYRLNSLTIETGTTILINVLTSLPTSLTYLNIGVRKLSPTLLAPTALRLPHLSHLFFGRLDSPLCDHHLLFLPRLMETLAIYAANHSARSRLTPAGWSLLPPFLRSLSIPDPFEELETPWDPVHLTHLLEFEHSPNSVDTFLRRKAQEFKKLQSVTAGISLLPVPDFVIDFEDQECMQL